MRYMLLICGEESTEPGEAPSHPSPVTAEYTAWAGEMTNRGVLRGGERLRPSTDATTVRVNGSQVLTSDGPFAETKEQIGGYFVVDCADLDEAIEVAAKLPGARVGAVEVRPIWDM